MPRWLSRITDALASVTRAARRLLTRPFRRRREGARAEPPKSEPRRGGARTRPSEHDDIVLEGAEPEEYLNREPLHAPTIPEDEGDLTSEEEDLAADAGDAAGDTGEWDRLVPERPLELPSLPGSPPPPPWDLEDEEALTDEAIEDSDASYHEDRPAAGRAYPPSAPAPEPSPAPQEPRESLRGAIPPSPQPSPPEPVIREVPARYANVAIRDDAGRPPSGVEPGTPMTVTVDIGPLRPDSDVRRPIPLPEELLPREDLWLDVMLSSPDVPVGLTPTEVGTRTAVEQRMLLPADGSAARSSTDESVLRFSLTMPEAARARARLTYLYRNVAIQSQRIDFEATSDARAGTVYSYAVTTDFTLSQQLGAEVADLERRDRMTIVMNETSAQHEFTVRAADAGGALLTEPAAFSVRDDALATHVARLREVLTRIAPTTRERRRAQLVSDLQRLAPLGWQLYASLPKGVQDGARAARNAGSESVIEIVLPRGSSFTLPWSVVYDIYLDSGTPAAQIPLCPSVGAWNEGGALVGDDARECPHRHEVDHGENLLCPFGFWGFRHSFEVLTTTDRPKQTLAMRMPCRVVVAETQRNINRDRLAEHVRKLEGLFAGALPGTTLVEAQSKADVRREIEEDLPFLYFLCHGDRDVENAATLLGVGKQDRISPADINGWIDVALGRNRKIWNDPQPLVFINACESMAITPNDIVDYLDVFVGKGNAVGVIGTEVRVAQEVAMQLAEIFFAEFLQPGVTLDTALHRVKLAFLGDGNLVGLVYTPYALADLAVTVS